MSVQGARPAALVPLRALASVALVTGLVALGGGLAGIARLRRVVVHDRGWMTEAAFVDRVAVAAALPGTMVTNLLVLVGHALRGARGAFLAPAVFVAPGCALIAVLAAYYDALHATRVVRAALDGVNPAVAGLVAAIAIDLGRSTLKSGRDALVALAATAALAARWMTLLEVVALAGVVGALGPRPPGAPPSQAAPASPETPARLSALALAAPLALGLGAPVWLILFGVFGRIGIATFGGGIAMVPAIEHEALARGWLDAQGFADAIAFGQVTPGPVATTATFVGWRAAGPVGALAATLGVFAPPTALAYLVARSLEAFRQSALVSGFLRGVAPAVVGIMAAGAIALGRASVHAWPEAAILTACAAARVAWPRASPLWLLALFAALGVTRALVVGGAR